MQLFLHSGQKVFASLVVFADDTLCFLNNIDRFQTSHQPAGTLLSSTDPPHPPTLTPSTTTPFRRVQCESGRRSFLRLALEAAAAAAAWLPWPAGSPCLLLLSPCLWPLAAAHWRSYMTVKRAINASGHREREGEGGRKAEVYGCCSPPQSGLALLCFALLCSALLRASFTARWNSVPNYGTSSPVAAATWP